MLPVQSASRLGTQRWSAVFIPQDQPRRCGPRRLVLDTQPREKSVSISIGESAFGTTAHAAMCAPSGAVGVHMPPSGAQRSVFPPGNHRHTSHQPHPYNTHPTHSAHSTHSTHLHVPTPTTRATPLKPTLSLSRTRPHLPLHPQHYHSPINVPLLAQLLSPHPHIHQTNYLLRGLTFGFSTGYTGPHLPRHAPNLPSATARPQVIDDYIRNECAMAHTAGPFASPPLPNFTVNPLGAVPKKRSHKWRLILHLSFPPGRSVNDGIDINAFPLRYSTVIDAMDSAMLLGRGALMAKIDVKSAFRLCPVNPDEQHLLGMRWKGQFFYDRVLPFGLRSAPYIFNTLAEAVEWIAREQGIIHIHHYLDDFFIAGPPHSDICAQHLNTLTLSRACAIITHTPPGRIFYVIEAASNGWRLHASGMSFAMSHYRLFAF